MTEPEVTPEVTQHITEIQDKWGKAKTRNSKTASNDLLKLEQEGVDVDEAREALENYTDLERSEYDSAEDFSEARTDAWEEFTGSLDGLEAPEVIEPTIPKAEVTPEITIAPEAPPMSAVEYDRRYTLKELREMARQEGLSASGSKKEIAAGLIAMRRKA